MTLTPDLCVIGAGPAGLAAAMGAAALGVPTVVVDQTGLSQALPRGGDIARQVLRVAARRRLEAPASAWEPEWPQLRGRATGAAEAAARDMSARRLGALGIGIVTATAGFSGPREIEAGDLSIRARRFIIATGSAPALPVLAGLEGVPWLTADGIFELSALPSRLVVLGGGSSGAELAQTFRRLGSAVVLVDAGPVLRDVDPELSAAALMQLAREGVTIRENLDARRAEPAAMGMRLSCTADGSAMQDAIEGSHLLVATGRIPNLAGLGLDKAQIRSAPTGIAVEPNGRTSNPHVYAIGDVVGLGGSLQAAEAQAGVVLRSALFRLPARYDPRNVPRVIHTDPEIATVGLSEVQARERVGRIHVLRWPFSDNARARAEGRPLGHIKVITAANGRVLGAGIVGPEAGEAIGLWALAVAKGLNARDIAALALPSPAYADLSRRAAMSALLPGLNNPWLRRARRFVRWLG